jgi:hypothetical protein
MTGTETMTVIEIAAKFAIVIAMTSAGLTAMTIAGEIAMIAVCMSRDGCTGTGTAGCTKRDLI